MFISRLKIEPPKRSNNGFSLLVWCSLLPLLNFEGCSFWLLVRHLSRAFYSVPLCCSLGVSFGVSSGFFRCFRAVIIWLYSLLSVWLLVESCSPFRGIRLPTSLRLWSFIWQKVWHYQRLRLSLCAVWLLRLFALLGLFALASGKYSRP